MCPCVFSTTRPDRAVPNSVHAHAPQDDRQWHFSSALMDETVSTTVAYDDQYGNPNEQPLSQLIAHLVNDGTQSRAQAAVRLTQLGLSPGDLYLIIFLRQHAQ